MTVILPLRAGRSPDAQHMGQFGCAKGTGHRQLHEGGAGGDEARLQSPCLGLLPCAMDGWAEKSSWSGSAPTQLPPALSLNAVATWMAEGLWAEMPKKEGRGCLEQSSYPTTSPGRSLLSTNTPGRGRSHSGSGPQGCIQDLM